MDSQTFSNISKIIERDSKFSTYKFALLRGTIEIIQENSPFIKVKDDRVEFPLGLLVEKWITYYYPILSSSQRIPQINGENKSLAFYNEFKAVINFYQHSGGLSLLYNELRREGINSEAKASFKELVNKIKSTIIKQPMRYIGGSISNEHYSIYNYFKDSKPTKCHSLNTQWLVDNLGTYSIPIDYYEAFKILGSFIAGTDSILFKWAEFSVNASKQTLSADKILNEVLKSPVTERDADLSKAIYKEILGEGRNIECVWSGLPLNKYEVDHLIPFVIWKNNDLWNLLPANPQINNQKRAKIVSVDLLNRRKEAIIYYWEIIKNKYEERFFEELILSLTGKLDKANWQNLAFDQLKATTSNLINTRGYEEWNYKIKQL